MNGQFYVNVFRDTKGKFHYSTEEFAVNHSDIVSFSDAVSDAYRLSVLGNWDYICTLSNNGEVSTGMKQRLTFLEKARFTVELFGKQAKNFNPQELLEESAELDS